MPDISSLDEHLESLKESGSSSKTEASKGSKSALARVGIALCRNSGTRSENMFYILMMGCCIGMILGTIENPWWLRQAEAPAVWYAFGTVLACTVKLLVLRMMIEYAKLGRLAD